jgi:uracil-DNA glycosylase
VNRPKRPAISPHRAMSAQGPGLSALEELLDDVRACRICVAALPLGPRPVLQVSSTARLLIASQAPGRKVHETGIPFTDASGDRLREWLGVSKEQFYDPAQVAILPMGLCYPGRSQNGGDAPPRPECAPVWRTRLLEAMPSLRLTLLVGTYAQSYVLGPGRMTVRVHKFRDYLPNYLPLPHPSWRSGIWEGENPWFRKVVLPTVRRAVTDVLACPRSEWIAQPLP